jgi:hypothetical protein
VGKPKAAEGLSKVAVGSSGTGSFEGPTVLLQLSEPVPELSTATVRRGTVHRFAHDACSSWGACERRAATLLRETVGVSIEHYAAGLFKRLASDA